jgi:hypothetical protein
MLENAIVEQTLDACKQLREAGKPVNCKTVGGYFRISRESASARLKQIYELGLIPRTRTTWKPAHYGVRDSEAAARINAVRSLAREMGRPLSSDEVSQALGD